MKLQDVDGGVVAIAYFILSCEISAIITIIIYFYVRVWYVSVHESCIQYDTYNNIPDH